MSGAQHDAEFRRFLSAAGMIDYPPPGSVGTAMIDPLQQFWFSRLGRHLPFYALGNGAARALADGAVVLPTYAAPGATPVAVRGFARVPGGGPGAFAPILPPAGSRFSLVLGRRRMRTLLAPMDTPALLPFSWSIEVDRSQVLDILPGAFSGVQLPADMRQEGIPTGADAAERVFLPKQANVDLWMFSRGEDGVTVAYRGSV